MKTNKKLLSICNIAIFAGKIIIKHYKIDKKVFIKKDNTPVTKADIASNKYIIKSLKALTPKIPILTEESLIKWSLRKKWSEYWLVDPLDGTKEFINLNGEFTVNIALIKNHKPVLGVIFAPALSLLYFGKQKYGSYKLITKNKIKSFYGSHKIKVNKKKKQEKIKVISSRSHANKKLNKWLKYNYKKYEINSMGSSLKFCEIAEGNADVYPRLGATCEWDTAAGHLILNEAGGKIKTTDSKKILYNNKQDVINPSFIASCKLTN